MSERKCYVCNEPGHFARECPTTGGAGSGGRGRGRGRGGFRGERSGGSYGRGCFRCGKVGHYAADCQNQPGKSI